MYKCRYCGYRFESQKALDDHLAYISQFTPALCVPQPDDETE